MRFVPVTQLAEQQDMRFGACLVALKNIAGEHKLLQRLPNGRGKRVWHVDLDLLKKIYDKMERDLEK